MLLDTSGLLDLEIGLADASLVVLAERHRISKVLTLDVRHFQALRIGDRKRFTLLP
jgi:predicted nucleic acid-binding protein